MINAIDNSSTSVGISKSSLNRTPKALKTNAYVLIFFIKTIRFPLDVDLTCSSMGTQCHTTWFWCDTSLNKCKCGAVYDAGTSDDTSCTGASKENLVASRLNQIISILFV